MRTPIALLLALPATAQDPPSVADWARLLDAGSWSVSLRVEDAAREGMRDGRDDLPEGTYDLNGSRRYTRTFNETRQSLHVAHGLEGCTLFARLPYLVTLQRDFVDLPSDAVNSDEVDGLGDLELGMTHPLPGWDTGALVYTVGLSIPTGAVDEPGQPYPMQPGSGTVDVLGGVAWARTQDEWRHGFALRGRLPISDNEQGWARSRWHVADAWISRTLGSGVAGRLALRNTSWGDVHGYAEELLLDDDALADDDRQGGTRTDVVVGLDWASAEGQLRVGFEVGMPVDEWLDGPQPSTELTLGLALRLAF